MKKLSKKSVPREQWRHYLAVADENYRGAQNNYTSQLWTPSAILIVHAAIAYTDALTVKAAGVKSTGESHLQAVTLVRQLILIGLNSQPLGAFNPIY